MCIGGHLFGRCCSKPEKESKPVPLAGVVVNAKLTDFVAEVSVYQRFVNIEEEPIEAAYLKKRKWASVSQFYAIVGGKRIEGKIKEKEQAKNDYDDAVASGHSAYLLEAGNTPNEFKTSIGNLPPQEEVVIVIVYVAELNFRDGQLEFVLPTNTKAYPDGVVNPKFWTPRSGMNIKPVVASLAPSYGLKVDINLAMTSKISSVSSPSHPINYVAGESNTGIISLANQDDVGSPLLKNFELLLSLDEPSKPVFRVQGAVAMLALYPNFQIEDGEEPITEMIFLVDRSGSMKGSKIDRVRDTLQIFLRSLPLGTFFNIIGFGTDHVSLFAEGSKQYDDATLQEATTHVKDIQANLGGTNLLRPLTHVLSLPPREGIPRQVFLLTDGEVDNTQECIDYVRQHSNVSRIFTFGIAGASPTLVTGIAKAGEGRVELISGNTDIEAKVMAQLKRALQPALTNLQINWNGIVRDQTPFNIPPLFNGSRLITYGYLSPSAAPGIVKLTAQSVKGDYTLEVAVSEDDLKPNSDLDFIPRLAARSMIRDLEENRAAGNPSVADAKNKIIGLSIKSGMLSKYTAFIAVNENDKPVEGSMQRRDVNEMYREEKSKKKSRNLSASTARYQSYSYKALGTYEPDDSPPAPMVLSRSVPSHSKPSSSFSFSTSSSSSSSALSSSSVKDIVVHQKAAGDFVEDVLAVLGVKLAKLRKKAPQEIKTLPQALLDQVCGILRSKHTGDVGQWELVDKKAISWVKKEVKSASSPSSDSLSSFDWIGLALTLANSF